MGTRRMAFLPSVLKADFEVVDDEHKNACLFARRSSMAAVESNQSAWKIGALFSGHTIPLQHEVVYGIWDYFRTHTKDTTFYMFEDGPSGLMNFDFMTHQTTDPYFVGVKACCGFECIGGKRGRFDLPHQFQKAENTIRELDLDGLVVIGGDDETINAYLLADHLRLQKVKTCVIGCPINSEMNCNRCSPCSKIYNVCQTYSRIIDKITSIARQSRSGHCHFVKLTGCAASHITLKCALQSRPNIALIGEETLKNVRDQIVNVICKRSELGYNYGVILIPERLFYFIPEVRKLIAELLVGSTKSLTNQSSELFNFLPLDIQDTLLYRITRPDSSAYCYTLGYAAGALVQSGKAGLIPSVGNLTEPVENWTVGGTPLASLVDPKAGKSKPVMKKSWVELDGIYDYQIHEPGDFFFSIWVELDGNFEAGWNQVGNPGWKISLPPRTI